ncbi:lipid II flippase MurJ [Brachybacterium sp. AOP25-B2-12]|uniref:lipid II flippase MurJ n=1 Tax=Brachybacterium sp. AOP25-B2-12 TaxID=3457710 RepID=UPI004034DD79
MTDPTQPGATGQEAPVPTAGGDRGTGARSRQLRASLVMASGSTVSRVLGFGRNFIMGVIVAGTGSAVGTAVSAANLLPNSVWIFIGGGVLNAILVPAIVRAIQRPDRGSDYVSRLMTLVVTAAAVLTLVSIALVPVLVTVTSGRLQAPTLALAIQLGFWMMPQIMFSALYVMCGQLLNAHESFGPFEWASVCNNIVGILGGLAFLGIWGVVPDPTAWTMPMIIAFAAFNVGGSAAQVVFLLFFVRRLGLRLRPRWGFRGLGLGKLSRIGLWTLAMLGVAQVGIWATRWSTGTAQEAAAHFSALGDATQADRYPSLYALDSSYMAFMIPQGIIAVALVSAAFPTIARHASTDDHAGVLLQYVRTSRVLLVPMMLATVLFIGLSAPIMYVIVGGTGKVGAHANALVLTGYMLGLVPFAATYLVKRVFYAYEDARGPFWMQLPNALASIVMIWPILHLVNPLWATAAATAASSVGNLLGWLLGLWLLDRKMSAHGIRLRTARGSGIVLAKLTLAGVVALVAGLGLYLVLGDVFWINRILTVVLGAVVGGVMSALFLGMAWLLRVQELRSVVDLVLGRLRRRRGTPPSAPAPTVAANPSRPGPGTAGAPFRSMVATPATASTPIEGPGVNPRPHDEELAARWRLESEIPLGGLAAGASWHRARSVATGDALALLIVRGSAASEAADAARRTFLVEDPHLLPIEDVTEFGEDGEDAVAVVSYPMPTAPPLAALLGEGTIRPETARSVIGEAATGLEAARRRGVRHEHLDSNRIFVDTRSGAVSVLGVGVEAATFGEESTPGSIAAYTDVTALVALLYRAVTGHSARRGTDGIVPLPSRVTDRTVPAELDALCDAVLNGSTQDAPANARQLIDWIQPWQSIPVTLEAYDPEDLSEAPPAGDAAGGDATPPDASASSSASHTAPQDTSPSTPDTSPAAGSDAIGIAAAPGAPGTAGAAPGAAGSTAAAPGTVGAAEAVGATAGAAGVIASASIARGLDQPGAPADLADHAADDASQTPGSAGQEPAAHPQSGDEDPGVEAEELVRDLHLADKRSATAFPAVLPWGPDTPEKPFDETAREASRRTDVPAGSADRPHSSSDQASVAPGQGPAEHGPDPAGQGAVPPGPGLTPAGREAMPPAPAQVPPAGQSAATGPGTTPGPSDEAPRGGDLGDLEDTTPVAVRTAGTDRAGGGSGPIVVPGRAASVGGPASAADAETRASLFRDVVSVAMDDERPATFDLGPETGPARSRQTQWILIGSILIVIVALVFAITSITSGLRETFSNPLGTTPPVSESAAPTSEPAPAEAAPSEAAPAPPAAAPPAISGIDISGTDHPDNAPRLTDGDPGTVWKSRQYRSPNFGNLKDGIGLTVHLAQPAAVTDVVLTAGNVTGGKVQLRTLNGDGSPGDVVAEGTFNGPGEIHLTPGQPLQDVGGVVVWIPELPQDGGTNIAEISEIRVA